MSFLSFNAFEKAILLFVLLFISNTGQLLACSCDFLTVKESVNIAPLIFRGKVISVNKVPLSETFDLDGIIDLENILIENKAEWFTNQDIIYRVEFENCTIYKGNQDEQKITIYTPIAGSACGSNFSEEETYVVYADYTNFFPNVLTMDDIWDIRPNTALPWTHLCMRNTTEVKEEEIEIIKEIELRNSFFQRMFNQFRKAMMD